MQLNLLGNSSFETFNDPFAFMSPARGRAPTFDSRTASGLSKHDADESDYSLGDISPIQLPSAASPNKSDFVATDNLWHGDRFHSLELTSGRVSNPFYVVRSSQKAFESCKYLLRAIRDDDAHVCHVNISHFGHIHQFKQNVSYLCASPSACHCISHSVASIAKFRRLVPHPQIGSLPQDAWRQQSLLLEDVCLLQQSIIDQSSFVRSRYLLHTCMTMTTACHIATIYLV